MLLSKERYGGSLSGRGSNMQPFSSRGGHSTVELSPSTNINPLQSFFFSDGLVQAEERGKNERWQCFSPQYCKMSQFLSMERAFVSKRRLRRSKCLGPFRTIAFAYNARSRTVLFFLWYFL